MDVIEGLGLQPAVVGSLGYEHVVDRPLCDDEV